MTSPGRIATSPASSASSPETRVPGGRLRWVICALLFFATTINYMDRQVIGILAPYLQRVIGWNDVQYGYIVTAFQAAYALGMLLAGRMIDRVGTRMGYAISIAVWSLSAMAHALANSVAGFIAARFMLGLGESGNFPAAIKTVAEWFPGKERALATGLFNAGSNVGAVLAPLAVPWIYVHWGWRWAFLFTGVFSAIWVIAWLLIYRSPQEHPRLSPGELAYIQNDQVQAAGTISWRRLLPHRQTWAFAAAKFLTDPIWWSFLDSLLPAQQTRSDSDRTERPPGCDLRYGGWRQHPWGLAFILSTQAWLECESGAQDGDGDLRASGGADSLGFPSGAIVAGGVADRAGCRCPSGLVL